MVDPVVFGADVCSEVEAVGEQVAALCAALEPGLGGDHEIEPVFDALVAMGQAHRRGGVAAHGPV